MEVVSKSDWFMKKLIYGAFLSTESLSDHPVHLTLLKKPPKTYIYSCPFLNWCFCRLHPQRFPAGAAAVRGHREQQQWTRFCEPRLRLQTRRFLPEEEKVWLREPAQTPQLQLLEVCLCVRADSEFNQVSWVKFFLDFTRFWEVRHRFLLYLSCYCFAEFALNKAS